MPEIEGGAAPAAEVGESLWRFSLALYARPEVATALIGLQERGGRDVMLILFLAWCGAVRGRVLSAADLATAREASAALRDGVVAPLRRERRRLKDSPDAEARVLRWRIAALELAAERRVADRLAAAGARLGRSPGRDEDAVAANLSRYLGREWMASREGAILRGALTALGRLPPS